MYSIDREQTNSLRDTAGFLRSGKTTLRWCIEYAGRQTLLTPQGRRPYPEEQMGMEWGGGGSGKKGEGATVVSMLKKIF